MSKKVFLGVGHGGSDPGASKYLVEKDVNLTIAKACRDELKAHGVTVKMSRTKDEDDPISEVVKECNTFNPDLAVDIHSNAGGGDGFEAIVAIKKDLGHTLAKNIEAEVKKLGQNSRGLKTKANTSGADYFGFIRSVKAPSIILEGVFVDNKKDVKISDTIAEQKAFGVAYAKGILKTLGIAEEGKKETSFKVRVNISNLRLRTGAGTNHKSDGFVKPGVYTITQVKKGTGSAKGWGKLKSGLGWISLDHAERL